MNYFISDLHFGHKNCMAFDNRPFNQLKRMTRRLLKIGIIQ